MATMTVKDLIEALSELDPNLPIHKFDNFGMPAIDVDFAGYTFRKDELAESKDEKGYFIRTEIPHYRKNQEKFGDPFEAVVVG